MVAIPSPANLQSDNLDAAWTFSLRSPEAKRVYLSLQLEGQPDALQPMRLVSPGYWQISLALPPRRCVAQCLVEEGNGRFVRSGPSMTPCRT